MYKERKFRLSVPKLQAKKGEIPLVMLTSYDAWMTKLVDPIVDMILVGDSLGMLIQGNDSTLPVTLDEMIYHCKMVMRVSKEALVVADLPFGTYQCSVTGAVESAARVMKEAGVQAVKIEGGESILPQVKAISEAGIPVVGHLGVTPQSVHALGGYGKQGKTDESAQKIMKDSLALQENGASFIVLENVPHKLAGEITRALAIPTIGIGAGVECDGQVQVFNDILGFDPDFTPRHAVKYLNGGEQIQNAIQQYADEVKTGKMLSK